MKRLAFLISRWKVTFTLVVFLFAIAATATAQGDDSESLDEFLERFSRDAAIQYVSPVITAFGSNLNGGWFHRAPAAKLFGLHLEVGLIGMGTFYRDEDKTFSVSGEFRFNEEQALDLFDTTGLSQAQIDALLDQITSGNFEVAMSGPTIIGDPDTPIEIEIDGVDVTIPDPDNPGSDLTISLDGVLSLEDDLGNPVGGFNPLAKLSFLPQFAPQISVGTVLGTQATFRYLPSVTLSKDIGKFEYFGWGIQHNPGVLLPTPLPLDISAGFFKQTLKVGTIFEANTTAYGLNVSKKLGIGPINITPYAGFMFEKSEIDVTYTFIVDDQEIDIDFTSEGENKSRIILGLSLRLLMFNLNADYNIGNYNSITLGVMFTI